jgi:hypothetical protein
MISRVIRLLLKRPGALGSPVAHLVVSLLALAGAAALVWSAVIHFELWADGFRDIPTIGPLFLAQGVGSIVLALLVVIFRRLALLVAGAVTLAATSVGLLLTVHVGLFNYHETLAAPYAVLSLWVEFTGAAVLLVGAVLLAVAPSAAGKHDSAQAKSDNPGNPSRAPFRN